MPKRDRDKFEQDPATLPKPCPCDMQRSVCITSSEGYDSLDCHVYISTADFLGPGCRRIITKHHND